MLFKRRHSEALNTFLPSIISRDSQARPVLQVKQMPPALEQFPLAALGARESKQIHTSDSKHRRGGLHGMMNEAKSTLRRRTGIDGKLTDPWI